MVDLPVQLASRLLLRCTKCDHTDQVDIELGEIHCGFCGNIAFVGKPAKFPFVEVVKKTEKYSKNYSKSDHDDDGTSPMQTGESISKKEAKNMGASTSGKCIICGVHGAVAGFMCPDCFKGRYGFTVGEYRANKQHWTETPESVALRINNKNMQGSIERAQDAGEKFEHACKEEKEKAVNRIEVKPETKRPGTKTKRAGFKHEVNIPDELYARIEVIAEREFRSVYLQVQYLIHQGMKALGL